MNQDPSFPLNPYEPGLSPVSTLRDNAPESPTFLPPQNAPEKPTLVLELERTLISSTDLREHDSPPPRYDFLIDYEINNGIWMVHFVTKRPGLDEFLEKMSSKYELVIFTEAIREYASRVVERIDPRRLISHRLYRDSCTETAQGTYLKNLNKIGRDITQMILVDSSRDVHALFSQNVIWVPEFIDSLEDDRLVMVGEFLEECSELEDLRDAVAEYA